MSELQRLVNVAVPIASIVAAIASSVLAVLGIKMLKQLQHAQNQFLAMTEQTALLAQQTTLLAEQTALVKNEAAESARWHRLHAVKEFFDADSFRDRHRELATALKFLDGINTPFDDIVGELSAPQCELILNNRDARTAVKHYLNYLEQFAAAVIGGIVDPDFSFSSKGSILLRSHRIFKPYIATVRIRREDPFLYIELENLVKDWEIKMKDRRDNMDAARLSAGMPRASSNPSAPARV